MNFKNWLNTFGMLTESQTVAQYLKQHDVNNQEDIYRIPEVKSFMEKVAIKHPLPYKIGKMGYWLRSDFYIPIQVTHTQETTVTLAKQNRQDWSDIEHLWPVYADENKKEIIIPKSKAILVKQDPFKYFLDWFAYIFNISGEDDLEHFFHQFFMSHPSLESLIDKYDNFKVTDFKIENLPKMVIQADERSAKRNRSNSAGPEGKTFIEFPNGWKWVDLECAGSTQEGAAAGHCGNGSGQPGENIYSLRDKDNRIHITVVVNANGETSEFKAPGNRKPSKYTHPYILEFLKNPKIQGVGRAKWDQANNFQITNFNHETAIELAQARPDIIQFTKIQECAIKAKGNQKEFQKLVKQTYNLQDFPYYFSYEDQAVLIDQGAVNYMSNKYNIMSNWNGERDKLKDNDLIPDTRRDLTFVSTELFGRYWNQLSQEAKEGILKLLGAKPDQPMDNYTIRSKLYHSKNPNVTQAMQTLGSMIMSEVFYEYNNQNQNTEEDFFIKLKRDGHYTTIRLLINCQDVDYYLETTKEIPPLPEYIYVKIREPNLNAGFEPDLDAPGEDIWFHPFYHAVEKSRFWERLEFTQSGKSATQEIEEYPGFKEKQAAIRTKQMELAKKGEHPIQIQVRNEQIRRELGEKIMSGEYDKYVKELQSKGWWEPFLTWAKQNNIPL